MALPLGSVEVWRRSPGERDALPSTVVRCVIENAAYEVKTMVQTGEIVSGSAKPAMLRVVIGWILCVLLAFVFLMVGGMKLLGKPIMVQEFNQVGLGQWFRYFTGTLEVAGGLGVLIPRFSRWAALLLVLVMVGALIAHFTVLHSPPTLTAILLVLAALTAWLRS